MLDAIVAQMSPSDEQKPAIEARDSDVAVTAGAGTGKTRTLVARYLSTLARGINHDRGRPSPRSVVAITFTRKAAWEMRNRVREEMRRYLERPDLAEEERERWQESYVALDAARIGTIHSLCSEILRSHPAEARVDPRFEVLEEGQANVLLHQVIDETLAWAADRAARDEGRENLFALLGEKDLRECLDCLLRSRLETDEILLGLLRESCGARRDGLAAYWEARLAEAARVPWLARELDALTQAGLPPLDRQIAEAFPALRGLYRFARHRYRALKRERNALDFDDLEGRALGLLSQDDRVRGYWRTQVRAILVDEFQDTNRRQRDLVRLLQSPDCRLFIVGDAKQSIYRFRGAEVAVFRAEQDRILDGGGFTLALDTSYRAHRHLISGLNDLLCPILGAEADPQRPWAVPFAPLKPSREQAGSGFSAPYIELCLAVGSKSDGALDRAADALVRRLADMVQGGQCHAVTDGRESPLGYGDIAILCRASASFGAYEDALERAGLPFVTVAGRGFYERTEIRDLLTALQALADPTDDLALAALLRSPGVGLSDVGLYRLCRHRQQAGDSASLWSSLPGALVAMPEDDARRAGRAVDLVNTLHERVGRMSVAEVLKAFLDETDYRAALIRAGLKRSGRNVSKLLADAHRSGMVSVGEFLEYAADLRDSGAREGEARTTSEGAVQIMSVHAAKGLEFSVVVIGDIGHTEPTVKGVLLDPELGILLPKKAEEEQESVLPAMYRLGKVRAQDQEKEESKRLFYVAATRAQEMLIFSGCFRLKKDGRPGYLQGWLKVLAAALRLERACPALDEGGAQEVVFDLDLGRTPVRCRVCEPKYDFGPGHVQSAAAAQRPVAAAPLVPTLLPSEAQAAREAEEHALGRRVWQVVPAQGQHRAPAWVIGSLVHEALAAWRFPGDRFEAWILARARGYGLTDARQLEHAARESTRLLSRFRQSSLFKEMERAERRFHEVPYSVEAAPVHGTRGQAGSGENGIIDALYLLEGPAPDAQSEGPAPDTQSEGRWTLVEFKTDDVRDRQDLEELLAGAGASEESYLSQVQRYVGAAETLLGRRPRAILCLLDYRPGPYNTERNGVTVWCV